MKERMFRIFKKASAAMIAGIMAVSMLAGCGASKTDDLKETTSAAASGTTGTPTASTPTKLTIATQSEPNIQDYETNEMTKRVKTELNLELEFIMLPNKAEDAKTKIALMVASGETLPDIIKGALDDVVAYDYASKGILVRLDDYFNNPEIAANFLKIPQEIREYMLKNVKLPDGGIYSLPSFNKLLWNEGPYRFWLNAAWLKKLSMQAPATTDELYTVLKAFVENDLNGNGKKDEIGIVGSNNGWSQDPIPFLMNAFVYANKDKNYFDVRDGKIVPSFTQPEWKQGLEYISKLIKDGLLSPLTFTQDQTQLKSLINVEGGMAGAVPSGSYSVFVPNQLGFEGTYAGYDLAAPIKGPNGAIYAAHNPSLPASIMFITKDCKNPETAFKLGDFFYDADTSIISRFGEEGVDWSDKPEDTDKFAYDPELSAGKRKVAIINNTFWGNPQNKTWLLGVPYFLDYTKFISSATSKELDLSKAVPDWNLFYNKHYVPAFPKEVISKLAYTPEELKKIAAAKTAIDAYVKDMAIAFVTGSKPFSEWDSYISELQKMGLDDYIAVNQAAHDRTK